MKLIIWCVVWLMQICSGKNGVFAPLSQSAVVKSTKSVGKDRPVGMKVRCMASSIPADRVPDMDKRNTMNLLLLGALSLPGTAMLVPYATFFAPPGFAFCSLLSFTLYSLSCMFMLYMFSLYLGVLSRKIYTGQEQKKLVFTLLILFRIYLVIKIIIYVDYRSINWYMSVWV